MIFLKIEIKIFSHQFFFQIIFGSNQMFKIIWILKNSVSIIQRIDNRSFKIIFIFQNKFANLSYFLYDRQHITDTYINKYNCQFSFASVLKHRKQVCMILNMLQFTQDEMYR